MRSEQWRPLFFVFFVFLAPASGLVVFNSTDPTGLIGVNDSGDAVDEDPWWDDPYELGVGSTPLAPDGSWIQSGIVWDKMPYASFRYFDDEYQELLHNSDGTFYPGDAFTARVQIHNTNRYYDKVVVRSDVLETSEFSLRDSWGSISGEYDGDKAYDIRLNTDPAEHGVDFTLTPALATLAIYTSSRLPTGYVFSEAHAVEVNGRSWNTVLYQDVASRTDTLVQGVYTISFGETYEFGDYYMIPPRPITIALYPGKRYEVSARWYQEESENAGPGIRESNGEDPATFVEIPSITSTLKVVVVPHDPEFAVVPYLWANWTRPDGTPPGHSFETPYVIMVRYDGNRYDPDNSERLSLDQRAVTNAVKWRALAERPKYVAKRKPQLADNGDARYLENGDVMYYKPGDIEYYDDLQPKMEATDLLVKWPDWGELKPLDLLPGILTSEGDRRAHGEETTADTPGVGTLEWVHDETGIDIVDNHVIVDGIVIDTEPTGLDVTFTAWTSGFPSGEDPGGHTSRTDTTPFTVRPFGNYNYSGIVWSDLAGYDTPPDISGSHPISLDDLEHNWNEAIAAGSLNQIKNKVVGRYVSRTGETWHREVRIGMVKFDDQNRYHRFVLEPNPEVMRALWNENYASVYFEINYINYIQYTRWGQRDWERKEIDPPTIRSVFAASATWFPLGFSQQITVTAWRLNDDEKVQEYLEDYPRGVLNNEFVIETTEETVPIWEVDRDVEFSVAFHPLLKLREILENAKEKGEFNRVTDEFMENIVMILPEGLDDNVILDNVIEDTTIPDEPSQFIWGTGSVTFTLHRYGGTFFYLEENAWPSENSSDVRTVRTAVTVPFDPDHDYPIDINLDGSGFTVEVQDMLQEARLTIYTPRQAGWLQLIDLYDNENNLLRSELFFPVLSATLREYGGEHVEFLSDVIGFSESERIVFVKSPDGPTRLRLEFANVWGGKDTREIPELKPWMRRELAWFQQLLIPALIIMLCMMGWATVAYLLKLRGPPKIPT